MSLLRLRARASEVAASYTPLIESNFEVGTLGTQVTNDLDSPYQTKYSDTYAYAGSKSGKCEIPAGSQGFGLFGGSLDYTDAVQGESIWTRLRLYFPTGFNFNTDFSLKTLRFHIVTAASAHVGYVDLYINSDRTLRYSNEIADTTLNIPGSPTLSYDTWITLEMQVLFHATTGAVRIWHDGTLVHEDTSETTLAAADGKSNYNLIFSYWNGGSPLSLTSITGTFLDPASISGSPTFNFNNNSPSADTIVRSTGDWGTDGYATSMLAEVTGTGSENGTYNIASVSGDTMTLVESGVLNDSTNQSAIIKGTELLTGGTSGATGVTGSIEGDDLFIRESLTGTFVSGETITGGYSGATGTLSYDKQYCYIDDIIVTTETPDATDGSGNPMIGTVKVAT